MQGGGGEVVLPVLRAPDNAADAVPPEQIPYNLKDFSNIRKFGIEAITPKNFLKKIEEV